MCFKKFSLSLSIFLIISFSLGSNSYSQGLLSSSKEKPKDLQVEVTADQVEYLRKEGKVIGRGNVVVIHGADKLFCDYAEVYTEEKTAYARGHVTLKQGTSVLKGDEVNYDFKTHEGHFPNGKGYASPFYGHGLNIYQKSKDKAIVEDAFFTTCNLPDPHYGVTAKKMIVYFDDKVIGFNTFFTVLGKKVFWWPYFIAPLNTENIPLTVKGGFKSDWGGYILTSKGYRINKSIYYKLHYDWRYKRGHAVGADLNYNSKLIGDGRFKSYYAWDKNSPNYKLADPEAQRIRDDRYWFQWKHRKDFDRHTYFLAEFNKLHDELVLKDFFENEYRSETDPETFLTFAKNGEKFGSYVNVELRPNHFVSTLQKHPEVRFHWNSHELGNTGVFYQNDTSLISFNNKREHSSVDDDVVRFDFYNKISYPKKIKQFNFLPFFDYRHSYYSKNAAGKEHLDRAGVGAGIEVNTRYFKTFDYYGNPLGQEFNQLRHIFEPSVKYDSIRVATIQKDTLFQLDEVDNLDDLDEVTFGLSNKLQTKRKVGDKMQRVDYFSMEHFINYEFHREVDGGSTWVVFDNELEWRPYNWLIFHHENKYDFTIDEFNTINTYMEFTNGYLWHLYFGHRYVGKVAAEEASNLLTADFLYKINDIWKVGAYVRHEFEENNFEEAEISFIRDLHCWILEFGANYRNEEAGEDYEIEVFFQLFLKEFPDYALKTGSRSNLSRGRFGDLIAGSSRSGVAERAPYEFN